MKRLNYFLKLIILNSYAKVYGYKQLKSISKLKQCNTNQPDINLINKVKPKAHRALIFKPLQCLKVMKR